MSIKSQTKSQQLLTFQYLKFINVLLNFRESITEFSEPTEK
jgi:hypothetical protein